MNKKILICTGGTGGHVIPAINLGNYFIKKGYKCNVILDQRGKKYSNNFKGQINIINSTHLNGNILFKLKSFGRLIFGFFQSIKIIIKFKPDICISFGSYATFTPLLFLILLKLFLKINLYIHEQNSVIGKVNLFFLPFSKNIFSNFDSLINLPAKYHNKKIYSGLPINDDKNNIDKNFKKNLNKKKIIFIYGGSQGSEPLIKKITAILENIDISLIKNIKLFIQCPKSIINNAEKFLNNLKVDFNISEYYHNVDEILSITDLAITRAGSGTINDIIKNKVPSLIFPLPHSIYNHQYFNAKYLTDKGAAFLMDEQNLEVNLNIFKKLIINHYEVEIMKNSLNEIILPNANKIIFNKINL